MQAKHYFTKFVAAFPDLFAALVAAILGGKELTQFRGNASFRRPSSFDMIALLDLHH